MATVTSVASGNWGTAGTWDSGVPVNGDTVVIAEGHEVRFNVDQSGFANGLAALTINGVLHCSYSTDDQCLKMNGNITGTGKMIIGFISSFSEMVLLEGYNNVYVQSSGGVPYEFSAPFRMARVYEGSDFGIEYSKVDSLEECESTPQSFYPHKLENGKYYYAVHATGGVNPTSLTTKLIMRLDRPDAGKEYRLHISMNSTGIISVPFVKMYGWYPEREYTQLSADAASGQNQIVLVDDLGLQQGDTIAIGIGTVFNTLHLEGGETTRKGIYTVQSYDVETKTVTLTENLEVSRIEEDYVCITSRTIKITRTSGTNALITSKVDNVIIEGVYINFSFLQGTAPLSNVSENSCANHCTSADKVLFANVINSTITKSTRVSGGSSQFMNAINGEIEDSICISGSYLSYGNSVKIKNCIQQNTIMPSNGSIIENCIFKNFAVFSNNSNAKYINCVFHGYDYDELTFRYGDALNTHFIEFYDCIFKDNGIGYFKLAEVVLHNCIFEGINEVHDYQYDARPQNSSIQSFDHNQIPGNYKAWCKGGTIETDTDGLGNSIPGRLIFNCESADYPVFRDFPMLLAAYKTNRWQALVNKSFTGGEVKIELIDPTSDPLIDSEATPLASYTLPDQAETNLPLKLGYKSDKAMQAILRISATNSEGTVEVDSRLIENRVQHG